MYGVITTVLICATFIWFAKNYLAPYQPAEPEKMMEIEKDINKDIANFDNIISEIYDRLDEVSNED